jgi:hypothetical protein
MRIRDINLIAFNKNKETYVFLFDDKNRAKCIRMFGKYATNPDLDFSWHDAADLSYRFRFENEMGDEERGIYSGIDRVIGMLEGILEK